MAAVIIADNEWLEELFRYELCAECGGDADAHIVAPDPLGLPHAWCKEGADLTLGAE